MVEIAALQNLESMLAVGSKAGIRRGQLNCPLYPDKRTSTDATSMSAWCHNVWPGRAYKMDFQDRRT
jgi:hypothetical protein